MQNPYEFDCNFIYDFNNEDPRIKSKRKGNTLINNKNKIYKSNPQNLQNLQNTQNTQNINILSNEIINQITNLHYYNITNQITNQVINPNINPSINYLGNKLLIDESFNTTNKKRKCC